MTEESHIYYDDHQLPELLDRLEKWFPLQQTALVLEAHKKGIHIFPCEEDRSICVSIDPMNTTVGIQMLAGVFGYAIAMVHDQYAMEFPEEIAAYDIRHQTKQVSEFLMTTNPSFAAMFTAHVEEMISSWYGGQVREAIITPLPHGASAPTPKPGPTVFDDVPLAYEHQRALEHRAIFTHMFGQTLTPPPINPPPDPAN